MVVKDEGVQDPDGTVYALEDGRRDGEPEGSQEAMAGFGQVRQRHEARGVKNTEDVDSVHAAGGRTFGADWKRSASNLRSGFSRKARPPKESLLCQICAQHSCHMS